MKLETIFEKFEVLAEMPGAVGKLRELVRQLAVTGVLVKQEEGDEPAPRLLENISAYKATLAKEGKLRGSTIVLPIPEDQCERRIPSSWVWVCFGDIMVNRDGERIPISKDERNFRAKIYDYYGASGVIDKIDGYLFDKPLLLIGEDGANLISRSSPIAFIARGKYWVNNHAHVLDGISEDFLRYIELYINAISLERYVTGSAQPKMNQAKMNSIPIALPPLAEQKRIVAKVDELMALCDRLEAQQQERETRHAALARASLSRFAEVPTPANLGLLFHPSYPITPAEFRKTILTLAVQGKLVPQDPNDEFAEELLGRISDEQDRLLKARRIRRLELASISEEEVPFAIPRTWTWVRLGQIGDWGSGSTPPRGNHELYGGGITWLKSGELNDNKALAGSEETVTDLAVRACSFRLNRPGDVLLAMYGATIGKSAILAESAVTNQAVCGCTPFRGILNTYLFDYLLSQRDALNAASEGGAQPNISKAKIVSYPFPLPPVAEQRRIVAKVDEIMVMIDALETHLATARNTASALAAALLAELTSTAKGGIDEA